ncbi:RT0821/Lpp0805 family surface protein [Ancylobacter terrae]|uniref:RT0821/Lpp0805 family surface protein n=1 Tax=Ancylobacter sp. sgz301288 TaxID=3342077 RepID=UPI00385CB7D0
MPALCCAGIALLLGGCAGMGIATDPIVTGSTAPRPVAMAPGEAVPAGVGVDDWVSARRALAEALATRSGAPSVPWENPASGWRGTATPLGEASAPSACRGFLVSLVREGDERWLEGEACRKGRSEWAISNARLLERS